MKNKASDSHPSSQRPVHYVLSAHWDREWYQPFQGFRHRLVHLLDRTMEALAAGKLHGPFTTDGQSIVLDDYLEIRPERAEQVRQMAKSGQLKVGPWFVMPDEWLVSGEAIVRNLELGRSIARHYGAEPSNAGLVCDTFGHISQLPQIFRGFGIEGALLWRGLEPRSNAHLWWEGADGTRILCYRFGRTGYCDYSWNVRRCHQRDLPFDADRANRDLDASLAGETRRSAVPALLLFDGGDHLEYDPLYDTALFSRRPGEEFPYRVRHSTLDDYLADVHRHADQVTDVVRGELRETAAGPCIDDQQWLIPGILSSRVWIKQANARCQTLLCHWAEPFGAAARAFTGLAYPAGFLQVAWRWLLTNHPHDSICGCSVDAVHEDMKYRFAQCEQIGENTTREALLSIAAAIEGEIGEKELRVVVANPLPHPLDEIVELTLQIPTDWHCFNEFFGFEPKPGFRIHGPDGAEIPYQRVAQQMNRSKVRPLPRHYPLSYRTNDVTVAIRLAVPALGYVALSVREGAMSAKDDVVDVAMLPTRHPATPGLAASERTMENENLLVTIEPNGTLTLTDKRSGETYSRLLTFEDVADIGDGWYHGQAVNDQAFVSTAALTDVALVADGPLLTRFRLRTTLRVPEEFKFDRMIRSDAMAELVLDSHVTLRRGAARLEIETTVHNAVRDHRLRVLFPTGARAATYLADSVFDVVERDIAIPDGHHLRRELPIETRPQQSWTAVADGQRGLAVIAPGLMESAVRDLPERPLALTLLRATRRTVFTDGESNGQLAGEWKFRYWLQPIRGEIDRLALTDAGARLGAGLRDVQLSARTHQGLFVPVPKHLPPAASFLGVSGEIVVTSLRERDGALEVRGFNPGTRATTAVFDFSARPRIAPPPQFAERVNFEGQASGERAAAPDGKFSFAVRPKEILTLRFTSNP